MVYVTVFTLHELSYLIAGEWRSDPVQEHTMVIQFEFVPKSSARSKSTLIILLGPVVPHQSTGSQLRASSVSIHSQVHSGDDRGEAAYIHPMERV